MFKKLRFLTLLLCLLAGFNAKAADEVWAFRNGSTTTPYAKYATLAKALNSSSLQNNDIIEFHGNTTETERATISKNNITIKSMEGACFTADYGSFSVSSDMYGAVTVNGKGLNISNIVFPNFSNPVGSSSQDATLFYVDNGAEVTFGVNCTVTNIQCPGTSNGAAVYINKGTVTVDGATFSDNIGMHGAAFYVEADGTLVVNDTPDDGAVTRLFGNEVKDTGGCGGAIANRDGTTRITGGEFYENYGQFGGSINNTGSLTISGGKFYNHVNCPAVANSGCRYCHVNGDPVFENNYGVSAGAAIQFQNWTSSTVGDCVIDGGTFKNNVVTWRGGAIHLANGENANHPVELTINGGTFEDNKSLQDGGAINIHTTCKLTITGGKFTGNEADIDKEDLVIGRGNAIWQEGYLMVSGNPEFGEDQDVHLVAMEKVITKSGDINASVLVPVTMPSDDEVLGRDILVSSTGHNVVKTDLQRFDVALESTTLAAGFTSSDDVTDTPVIELKKGGPFYVVSLEEDFPTLQKAVDAAATTDEIRVRPCSDFGVEEYGASYATYNTDYISANGAEVYVEKKSLTFKSMNGKDTAPLRDFAIVLVGNSENKYDYTFDDLKFLGASIIILDNYELQANFGTITVNKCYAETCTLTHYRKLLKTSHDLGNTGSSSAFLQWVQRPGIGTGNQNIGKTDAVVFTGNTVKGTLLTTGGVTNTSFISGGSAPGTATITGNTFGDYDHNKSTFGIVFQTSQDNANIYVSGNKAYLATKGSHFVWVGMYLPNPIQGVSVDVNNNEIFTGSKMTNPPTRPYTISPDGTTATPSFDVVYVSNQLYGIAKTYRNYVNDYCYNHIKIAVTNGAVFDADEQHGHTNDDHVMVVPQSYGKQKAVDIYLHNEADVFDGESHHDFDMGTTYYCDRCDGFEVAWPGYVTGRTDVTGEVAVTSDDYEVSGNNVMIKTANGFAWLVNVVNGKNGASDIQDSFSGKTVTLVNDIDMTAYIWMPIGTPETPFQGTFDGNGKVITGVWNSKTFGEPGLFGYVSGNGVIKNTFVQISGTKHPLANTSGGYYGIVANTIAGSAIVHSSEVMGTIEATDANAHIGGVVGKAEGSSEVHSVISYATLNGYDMGGIVNTLDGGNAKLSNSYAKATFVKKGSADGKDLAYSGTNIANCYYVQGTTQKMSDGVSFEMPTKYGYGVSGCMVKDDRMVDVMNGWVKDNGAAKYAAWSQPTTTDINGDCPVLKLKDFNTMARRSGQAQYLFYDADLDSQLTNANNTAYLFYGAQEGVETDYSGSNLYIDQDAALKTKGTVKANVGVVSGSTYGWHMFSTALSDAPLGINYDGYVNVGNDHGTPQTQVSFNAADGYFPEGSPYAKWDFYCFDESNSTWVNYKRNTGDHFDTYTHDHISFVNETNLVPGRGYLMALQDMTYMQGYGTLNNADVDATVTCSGHHVTGCNFIGNPYHAYLDFEEFYTANSSNLASASYSVIADGSYASYAAGGSKNPSQASRYIHPHQGFIVKVNAAGSLTFAPKQAVVDQTSPYREAHVDYPLVNLFATDSEGNREIATAELGRPENGGALKIEGMQMGKCTMSISNQGERYGIAFIEGNPEEVAVHFQATEDGDFTMKWNTYNGTFSYLHLIDNLTGMDIDCLSQSEYKFTASTGDYASRFKLKFEFTGIEESQEASESSSSFAFFHQGSLMVNGQGNLELIDLNGRVLMTKNLGEGQSTVALPEVPEGLYLLRLADDSNVKTQKIIIK